jgi:hypothetical protein
VIFLKKFIDFDKFKKVFYDNFYFDDGNIVLKIPLVEILNSSEDIRIEYFNLAKYTYLLAYD